MHPLAAASRSRLLLCSKRPINMCSALNVSKLRRYTDPPHPLGWGESDFFLAESQSGLYPHMRAKFGRDPTAVSKKVSFKFIIGYNSAVS